MHCIGIGNIDLLDATNNVLISSFALQTFIEWNISTTTYTPSIFPPEYSVMRTMHRIAKSNIRIILESSEAAWTETSEDELCREAGQGCCTGVARSQMWRSRSFIINNYPKADNYFTSNYFLSCHDALDRSCAVCHRRLLSQHCIIYTEAKSDCTRTTIDFRSSSIIQYDSYF